MPPEFAPTTRLQHEGPLSANLKKSLLHKLFNVKGLQDAENMVMFFNELCALREITES
jgi:hypothetical protein